VTTPEIPILQPPTELSAASEGAFDALAAPHLDGTTRGLVIDLSEVVFITSAGLGRLVFVGRTLDERGAAVVLAGGRRSVVKLIRTVGLDSVMPHFHTVEEAVEFLQEKSRP
jgi:anti-anti-sigma factor